MRQLLRACVNISSLNLVSRVLGTPLSMALITALRLQILYTLHDTNFIHLT